MVPSSATSFTVSGLLLRNPDGYEEGCVMLTFHLEALIVVVFNWCCLPLETQHAFG